MGGVRSLHTADGRPVEILFPGIPNNDSGPDFLGARVRIGGVLYTGAVEVHRDVSDWAGHGHQIDERYNTVILHVAFSARAADRDIPPVYATRSGRPLPLLLISRLPDAGALLHSFAQPSTSPGADEHVLACSCVNELVPPPLLHGWLQHLGRTRMEEKSARWGRRLEALLDERRAREGPAVHTPAAGVHLRRTRSDYTSPVLWDQALYEGLMEGLGYSKNRAAFRTLARSVPLASLRRIGLGNTGDILAILFGASHLLPEAGTMEEPLARRYAAGLAGRWRELSHAFHPVPLHRSDWLFFRLRPPNFPTARLAAFAHALPIVFGPGFRGCLDILRTGAPPARTLRRLASLLIVRAAGFWRYRTHFDTPAAGRGSAIGRTRATELVINTVLPLSLRCADMFGDSVVRDGVGSLMTEPFPCPAPRLMARLDEDLLRGRVAVETPLLYQGAVGLFADHCTKLRCRACAVGEACGFVRSSAVFSSPRGRGCC